MNPQFTIPDPQSIRRLLVRGVNWLGDAVMTTPALLRLRERFAGAHLTLLTPVKLRDLWRHHPAVDEIVAVDPGESLLAVGRKLRGGKYDLALVLPNSPRSALEVWLARISQRIGYARPWRNWFLTRVVPSRPGHSRMHKRSVGEIKRLIASPRTAPAPPLGAGERAGRGADSTSHHIHEYLHLVAALGANPEPLAPALCVTAEEVADVRNKFGLARIRHPILGLCPGAEYGPAKCWPADRFVAVAREIQRRTDCAWLIFGGDAETALAREIAAALRPPPSAFANLAGRTSLRELMALLNSCRALLTNDTGPMHVAAALGTPAVALFGSTSPALTGPGLPGDPRHCLLTADVPCAPCFRRACPIDLRCMNGISVERASGTLMQLLRR